MIEHEQDQPLAPDTRGNLVDLRVGNKPEMFVGETHECKGWSFKMRQYVAAMDEDLCMELVDVEANPLRRLLWARMNQPQKRRARQLLWRRFQEEWEPVHRGRYRAMLMQLLQFPFTGDRGQALEEWERLLRQYEAQSSDTLQDTIKAAILTHNSQDPEWRRHVELNATRLREYDALRSEWKAMHQTYRKWSIADENEITPMESRRTHEKQR